MLTPSRTRRAYFQSASSSPSSRSDWRRRCHTLCSRAHGPGRSDRPGHRHLAHTRDRQPLLSVLGINPIQTLLGSHLLAQPGVHASVLLGRSFFPSLIASPFAKGLHMAFIAAAVMCFIGRSSVGCVAVAYSDTVTR